MQLSIKALSLQKKMAFISYLLVFSGMLTLALVFFSFDRIRKTEERYESAALLQETLSELKQVYKAMEAADYGFMLDPTNEALWEAKLATDEAAEKLLIRIREMARDPEILTKVSRAVEIDEKILNPSGRKALELLKTDRAAALRLYTLKNIPGYEYAALELSRAVQLLNAVREAAHAEADRAMNWSRFTICGILLLSAIVTYLGLRKLAQGVVGPLTGAIGRLAEQAQEALRTANAITASSQGLAQAATEQAAALQETSASVEEMTAMISKAADNAESAGAAANKSSSVAGKGKNAVAEMVIAIREINESNDSIMARIDESNERITEITRLISEIGEKTKVINDIVFQTKLLSFNASVEAARAGEQGKGFAVVAEEVGSLAEMSGRAAKEIGEMLGRSIAKVETIVVDTKRSVEQLMEQARAKVATGTVVAEGSGRVLEELVASAATVSVMVAEVATAAREQSAGVGEITKAMNQLDQVTHSNSAESQRIAEAAATLASQAAELDKVVGELRTVIDGEAVSPASDTRSRG